VFLEILDNGQSPKTLFFQVQYAIVRILQNWINILFPRYIPYETGKSALK
jgi:hypothetical protein